VTLDRYGNRFPSALSRNAMAPVFFLTALFFLNFIARILLAPFLPTIERDLGITHSGAGFFFFLVSAGYLVGLTGSGFLSARLNHRTMITLSCASVGIVLLAISAADSMWAIRAGLVCLGLATGLYMPSAIATITSLVPSSHWGKAIAIHETAPNLAFVAAPLAADLFLRFSSWRAALGLLGAVSVIVAVLFHRYGKGGEFSGEPPSFAALSALLRQPAAWMIALLFGLGVSSTLGIFSMLPLYLVSERRMEQSWVNTLVALSRISGPFMALAAGWVSDSLGPRRTIAGSFLLTGLTTLLLGPAPTAWLVPIVFLQPALAVCFFPAAFAALAAIAPARSRNVAVSFTVPAGFLLGGGAIPAFLGVMGDAGSFGLGFTWVGALILAGAALALFLRLPERRS
jgi:predicted MFS family arabinose efflux permease